VTCCHAEEWRFGAAYEVQNQCGLQPRWEHFLPVCIVLQPVYLCRQAVEKGSRLAAEGICLSP
jgi:hypothetical protein